jgi:hypothetical protein
MRLWEGPYRSAAVGLQSNLGLLHNGFSSIFKHIEQHPNSKFIVKLGLPQKASDLVNIGFQRYLIILCARKYD